MAFANVEKITLVKQNRNTIRRWSEHDNPTKGSEPARHLYKHNHVFAWKILCHASKKD